MAATRAPHPTRERIVHAALAVVHERGLVNASVRAIVHEAGCSEALLYKHFDDKQQMLLAMLEERLLTAVPERPTGGGDLAALVADLMHYFAELFPIAGSLFGAPELLAAHRARVRGLGGGPEGPAHLVTARLAAEQAAGRIGEDVDIDAVAQLLVGAAFQQGFLAAYSGRSTVVSARDIATRLVDQVLPALA